MNQRLKRELGLGGAIVTGLGSILGTGAFVAIGVASTMWGDVLLWAIPLAALVAVFNGLSSAFLAGRFPVAGGTYEYGYRAINEWFGFGAGWLFILAKTASAATAALGIALYLGHQGPWIPILAALGVTALVIAGIRRTTFVNLILVLLTIGAIIWFWYSAGSGASGWVGLRLDDGTSGALAAATAFLFVAYTGYGRIATLGEEVKDPERTIPRAVVITLGVAATLYMLIELGGRSAGGEFWGIGIELGFVDDKFIQTGAIAAMAGVLLNLVLGLSRVWLAMGRRADMPTVLAKLDSRHEPVAAVVLSGVLVSAVTLIGNIALAWSFSAMTVLLYYGITNLAALRIAPRRVTAWAGLASCLILSVFVPPAVWMTGVALIVIGLLWKTVFTRYRSLPSRQS